MEKGKVEKFKAARGGRQISYGGIIIKWVDQRALNVEKKTRNKLTQCKHTGRKQIITVKKRNQKKSNTVMCVTCLTIWVLQLEVSREGLI